MPGATTRSFVTSRSRVRLPAPRYRRGHAAAQDPAYRGQNMFGLVEPEGLQTLEAMGFTRDAAKAALTAHNGDVAAAAAQLSQPSVEDKCEP